MQDFDPVLTCAEVSPPTQHHVALLRIGIAWMFNIFVIALEESEESFVGWHMSVDTLCHVYQKAFMPSCCGTLTSDLRRFIGTANYDRKEINDRVRHESSTSLNNGSRCTCLRFLGHHLLSLEQAGTPATHQPLVVYQNSGYLECGRSLQ